jgi:hypothetical protein
MRTVRIASEGLAALGYSTLVAEHRMACSVTSCDHKLLNSSMSRLAIAFGVIAVECFPRPTTLCNFSQTAKRNIEEYAPNLSLLARHIYEAALNFCLSSFKSRHPIRNEHCDNNRARSSQLGCKNSKRPDVT